MEEEKAVKRKTIYDYHIPAKASVVAGCSNLGATRNAKIALEREVLAKASNPAIECIVSQATEKTVEQAAATFDPIEDQNAMRKSSRSIQNEAHLTSNPNQVTGAISPGFFFFLSVGSMGFLLLYRVHST